MHALRFVERVQALEFIAIATMMIVTMATRENEFEPRLGKPPADQAPKVKGARGRTTGLATAPLVRQGIGIGAASAEHPRPLCTRLEEPRATGVRNVTAGRGEGALCRQCRRQGGGPEGQCRLSLARSGRPGAGGGGHGS